MPLTVCPKSFALLLCYLHAWYVQRAFGSASISLENPNGQRLLFLRLSINAALSGPFALVENEMVFQNPEDRQIEGRFSFALPTSAAGPAMPSRFAMEIQGKLMEGEVVNTSKARKIFRDILHEARDPALLEQSQGNIFTARVFPIEPHAIVRLILSYALTTPLRSLRRTITLPLTGLPQINDFNFFAVVNKLGNATMDFNCSLPSFGKILGTTDNATGLVTFAAQTSEPIIPETDVVIEISVSSGSNIVLSANGGQLVSLFTNSETPNSAEQASFLPSTWRIYVDTSASTADTALVRAPLLAALLDAMPEADVEVFAFDIEVVELRSLGAKDAALGAWFRHALETRLSLGATDLQMLLEHIDSMPSTAGQVGVLILTDAIPTASERAAARLGELLADSTNRVVELGVIGNKFDSTTGGAIAAAGNGRIVRIPLTSQNVTAVAAAAWVDLTRPLGRRATPQVAQGWVWPEVAYDVHDGDEVLVFSGGGEGLTVQPPHLHLGGLTNLSAASLTVGTLQIAAASFSSLLAREVTRARLELLESHRQLANNTAADEELKFQIVKLSEQSRVMCPHTALMVLETEDDYVRFGIARDSLAPILVVTPDGVLLRHRNDIVLDALPTTLTFTSTTITNSTNTSVDNTNSNDRDEPPPEESDIFDDENPIGPSSESSGSHTRSSINTLLLFFFAMFWGASTEWVNLENEAATTLQKYGVEGPTERRRDIAMEYAGALWTKRETAKLRSFCAQWLSWDPANGLAYEYLGKATQDLGDTMTSLRAVTSIVEVAPRDPQQLLRGAWVTMTLSAPEASSWALRFAERSLQERNDNPNTYRAMALAAWRTGNFLGAARAYKLGLEAEFHGRYGDVHRVLEEEAALFFRGLGNSQQSVAHEFSQRPLKSIDPNFGKDIRLRITLSWLTDANDVDLHVIDPNNEECFYSHKTTASGLELYSDQTQGLGPEVIVLHKHVPGQYRIGVKYFSAGAMGASRGTVVIWQLVNGVPQGDVVIKPFTLPAGYSSVLPVTTINLQ